MNSTRYITPEDLDYGNCIGILCETEDALARLDERVKASPLRSGLLARLPYHEACACRLADGELVDLSDLMLFAHRVWAKGARPDLAEAQVIFKVLQLAGEGEATELLMATKPSEADRSDGRANGDEHKDKAVPPVANEALTAWRALIARTRPLPALLAAAIAWDAWISLSPEPHGSWKAPLLAALVLKARGKMSFLLPIDLGRRHHIYRRSERQPLEERIKGLLEWALAGGRQTGKELDRLIGAEERMLLRCKGRNRNTKAPALVQLLLARPLVSIPMIAKELKVTQRGARLLLSSLGSTPREMSGLGRYRVWGI